MVSMSFESFRDNYTRQEQKMIIRSIINNEMKSLEYQMKPGNKESEECTFLEALRANGHDDIHRTDENSHYIGVPPNTYDIDVINNAFEDDINNRKPNSVPEIAQQKLAERFTRDITSHALFTQPDNATLSIYYAVCDNAGKIADWLTRTPFRDNVLKLDVDFDDRYIGAGIRKFSQSKKEGEMFPEYSTQDATVVLKKDKSSKYFFKIQTAYPNIHYQEAEKTGKYYDEKIRSQLKNPELSPLKKVYWSLALSGYDMSDNLKKLSIRGMVLSAGFKYEGKEYQVLYDEDITFHGRHLPYVKSRAEGTMDKFVHEKFEDLPLKVQREANHMDKIAETCSPSFSKLITEQELDKRKTEPDRFEEISF